MVRLLTEGRTARRGAGRAPFFTLAALAAFCAALALVMVRAADGTAGGGVQPDASFKAALQVAGLFTSTHLLEIAEVCQKDHAERLAEEAHKGEQTNGWSSCHSSEWLSKFQEIGDQQRNRTFIDIGCNKGYTSSAFFALWAPEVKFTPNEIIKWRPETPCGACGDCNEIVVPKTPPPPLAADRQVQVVCVEPNLVSFASLVATREHFFFNSTQPWAQWHLVLAAISNSSSSTASFPRCSDGLEMCGFAFSEAQWIVGQDVVPLWTVDKLLAMYDMQYVDVLKIDTEGFDVEAIASGMSSILGGRVGVLAFEYHGIANWGLHKLEHLVERLDGLNYVCYLSGKAGPGGSLARMTGCWGSSYEFHSWSNVVCIRRDHELYPHAEKLTTRYAQFEKLYFGQPAAPQG